MTIRYVSIPGHCWSETHTILSRGHFRPPTHDTAEYQGGMSENNRTCNPGDTPGWEVTIYPIHTAASEGTPLRQTRTPGK